MFTFRICPKSVHDSHRLPFSPAPTAALLRCTPVGLSPVLFHQADRAADIPAVFFFPAHQTIVVYRKSRYALVQFLWQDTSLRIVVDPVPRLTGLVDFIDHVLGQPMAVSFQMSFDLTPSNTITPTLGAITKISFFIFSAFTQPIQIQGSQIHIQDIRQSIRFQPRLLTVGSRLPTFNRVPGS